MPKPSRPPIVRTVLAAVFVAASAVAQPPAPDAAEVKKLLGTWEGYAVLGKGEKADSGPVHLCLTIADGKMSAIDLGNGNKDMGTGTFKLDPTKAVKELDATGVVLPGKREKAFLGVCEIDGDTLRWCVDNRQQGRPAEFRTGNGNYLLVLKRVGK